MLLTVVLTALFTAGLIDRLLEPRLLGLVGSRTPPRKNHVIVVGMGQVGVRLCAHLRAQHVPVIGVERDRHAPHLAMARRMGIPVVVGSGTERRLLEKLRLDRCRALAAVASDDLDNIAVAVTATAVSPSTRVILRAGEGEAIAETRSLLPLGEIRDVTEIAATFVVARLLGRDAQAVVATPDVNYLRGSASGYRPFAVSQRDDCVHPGPTMRQGR
jgi:Trk K+ transport system NAD-binding subunit